MKNCLYLVTLIFLIISCKKENKKNEPAAEPTPVSTPTMPVSNYKRVKILKEYDTINNSFQITTHEYFYDNINGRLATEVVTDTTKSGGIAVSTYTFNYGYTSFGLVNSYTNSSTNGSGVIKFNYDSITHKVINQVNATSTSTVYTFSHQDSTTTRNEVGNPYNATSIYVNGDVVTDSWLFQGQTFNTQYSYDPVLLDKSKLFFAQTNYLPAKCRLLTSIYAPASPGNPSGPTTVTYTYSFDADGYPVSYQNSKNLMWRVYYY